MTLLPYAASDRLPTAWKGWQTMLNVFLKFFRRPTLSNRPTRVSKSPCSQWGQTRQPIQRMREKGLPGASPPF